MDGDPTRLDTALKGAPRDAAASARRHGRGRRAIAARRGTVLLAATALLAGVGIWLDGIAILPVVGTAAFAVVALALWQTSRKLRRGDELLHGILSGTTDAIAVKDTQGRYIMANDVALGLLGRTREEVIGRTDADLLPPEIAGTRHARDETVLLTGRAHRYWRRETYDGVQRSHSVVKLPYRDRDGAIRGVVSVARDETPLRNLEAEATRFFDLAPDLFCTVGADGRADRVNDAWTRVLGWTAEEVRSRPLVDFLHRGDRNRRRDDMSRMLAGDVPSCTTRVATRSGGWRLLEWTARTAPGHATLVAARDVTDRDTMRRALAESETRYRTLVHNLPGGAVLTFDHDLRFTFAAGEALELIRGHEQLVGRTLTEVSSATAAGLVPRFRAALAGKVQSFEHVGADGDTVRMQIAPVHDADGGVDGGMVLFTDVTERKLVEREIAQAETRFRSAFDAAPIGMALISLEGRYLQVNPALCAITGHTADDLLHRTIDALTHEDDVDRCRAGRAALLDGRMTTHRMEKRYVHVDGHEVWVDVHRTLIRDADGRPSHMLAQIQDITDRRHFEGRLRDLAERDPLTGLLNRRRFEQELAAQAAAAGREGAGALLVLNLDDLKLLNDSAGHAAGDQVILAVAGILRAELPDVDLIARLGGDEFAVLLPEAGLADAEAVGASLVRTVREEAVAAGDGQPLRVTTSIGIAAFGPEVAGADEVLVSAHLALYDAKDAGRDGYAVHSGDADARGRVQAHAHLLRRIRDAVAEDRLVLHAQPILDLRTGALDQHELLVRLPDASGDLMPPAEFLPLAERYDLVQLIDRWVARRAVELVAVHAALDLRLTVNLSGRTLGDETLLQQLERDLARTGADPGRVTFEVTETAAVSNLHRARAFAERLRALGCRFSLDDFGAGFGSFYYLKHLPFDFLKIDGEFVAGCLSDRTDQLVIRAVVDIAQGLGKETIAEFASDPDLVRFLETQGIDYAQGFEIGRPVPVEEAIAELQAPITPA